MSSDLIFLEIIMISVINMWIAVILDSKVELIYMSKLRGFTKKYDTFLYFMCTTLLSTLLLCGIGFLSIIDYYYSKKVKTKHAYLNSIKDDKHAMRKYRINQILNI
jgi:hypothetical protein